MSDPQPVQETLKKFLYRKFDRSDEYRGFEYWKAFQEQRSLVDIQNNLHTKKQLREYQIEPLLRFMYLFENKNINQTNHLLFEMATGTGKTLVMASLMLYLYQKGYRNFLFLTHLTSILEQAKDVFTNKRYSKYLFNPDKIVLNGGVVDIKEVKKIDSDNINTMNIMLTTIQNLHNQLKEAGESRIAKEDFQNNKVIVFADEAHHFSGATKNKMTKKEEERETSWESVFEMIREANSENIVLDFTATPEISNQKVNEKYEDKLIYKYDFINFRQDGYSKNITFLSNPTTDKEDEKRLLIVNAVVLSEYRKMLFDEMKENVNPILLIKSNLGREKINASRKDKEFFHSVIETLNTDDLRYLRSKTKEEDPDGFIRNIFNDLHNRNVSEQAFIDRIKESFAENKTIIYNSKDQRHLGILKNIDNQNPREPAIRAVFSVKALNEGWDVLSLYDVIHFDIPANKEIKTEDIQFIGRGTRYCPFEVQQSEDRQQQSLLGEVGTDRYKRKFDEVEESNRNDKILDYFCYHFVETGHFREKLSAKLKKDGVVEDDEEKQPITMKDAFLHSNTYQKGFILKNKLEKRKAKTAQEQGPIFDDNDPIIVRDYELFMQGLDDENKDTNPNIQIESFTIQEYFSEYIVRKALVKIGDDFFRFYKLKGRREDIKSIDDFIQNELNNYSITYKYYKGSKSVKDTLESKDKLSILVNRILPEVRKAIEEKFPVQKGSKEFRPMPIRDMFQKVKHITISPTKSSQNREDKQELQLNIKDAEWFVHDDNYGNEYEKQFVVFMNGEIQKLKNKYQNAEIFLIRNEREFYMYSMGGKRFEPDFILFINDCEKKKFYYQCIFEPKGEHLENKDRWKEKLLQQLDDETKISYKPKDSDDKGYREYLKQVEKMRYKEIRNIGFSFFNPTNKIKFEQEFSDKILK